MEHFYFEVRRLPVHPTATLGADIAKHLQSRQYLGTALIVCDNPHAMMSATRKLWLKGARYLQKLRASTLNAEEILRLTHAIMHMQNMLFLAKTPLDNPDGAVYFLAPEHLEVLPQSCYSIYLTTVEDDKLLRSMCAKLPAGALIVDYATDADWPAIGAAPKIRLEAAVLDEWQHMAAFLRRHRINPDNLMAGNTLQFGAMDDALDTLLGVSSDFLRHGATLQHALNLAKPLVGISTHQQKIFEAVTRLAHRVQSLSPGSFNTYLIQTFGDKEAQGYFLRDAASELYLDLEQAAGVVGE